MLLSQESVPNGGSGLIIFVIGAVLIDKYIGFSKDETPSDRSSGSNNSGTSSKTKVAWDFYLSKESVLEYLERYYNYYENKFYRNSDWPNIYRLDDYYKETILAPFRELLSYAPEELEFIRYENDDFTSDKQTATVIHTAQDSTIGPGKKIRRATYIAKCS